MRKFTHDLIERNIGLMSVLVILTISIILMSHHGSWVRKGLRPG